jgi:hypothetical protein
MLNKEVGVQHDGWGICKRIWRLLELDWEVHIRHTYCEVNVCADMLAHVECELGSTMIIYESYSAQISHFVIVDACGTLF